MRTKYERFCDKIENIIGSYDSTKIFCGNIGFATALYETCKDVAFIGLNAEKMKTPGETKVYGKVLYSDVDTAVLHIIAFTAKYPEICITDLLDVIETIHKYANDGHALGIVWDSDMPSIINFAELPTTTWNNVRIYVEECYSKGITPDSAHSNIFNP
ncbi:MAG: hypothetical protein IJO74_00505 [Clostridia bacterium]|nr:hypothetical protein [Clostridia bacterium]